MKKFPILYKKASTGKIQTWEVSVTDATMTSLAGQMGGVLTPTVETILEGKNIGKKNETTPEQQALLEAEARWTKKKKGGYVEKLDDASEGKVDDIIEGGYNPTLAHSFARQGEKILFPCIAQPKLDGIRCCAEGSSLWSRTRKPIISVPHINHALQELGITAKELTDGELYNHDLRDNFERITHIVGQKKEVEQDHFIVQYHIYDFPSDKPYSERLKILEKKFGKVAKLKKSPLRLVESIVCNNEEELMAAFNHFVSLGYEGAMARNLDAPYEYKRSYNLQKIKEFDDAEFTILGVKAGKNNTVVFECMTSKQSKFEATMSGDRESNQKYLEDSSLWEGKQLTVKYQGFTTKSSVPRFPIGLRIRNE